MSAGRELLEKVGPAVEPCREIRYLRDGAFDDVDDDDLRSAARSLRAISYSCLEGARKLEKILRGRCDVCGLRDTEDLLSEICEFCASELEEQGS